MPFSSKSPLFKLIELPKIGSVYLRKSKQASKISLKIKADGAPEICLPAKMSFAEGERILRYKSEWIQEGIVKLKRRLPSLTVFGQNTPFSVGKRVVKITCEPSKMPFYRIYEALVGINLPPPLTVESPESQQFIRTAIEKAWEIDAGLFLPKRTRELAEQHGFVYQSLRISRAKTKWGSCTHDNRLSLSLHLMRLPSELCDYVILHELCHTLEKNHQAGFWQLAEQACGGRAKEWDRQLNQYRIESY